MNRLIVCYLMLLFISVVSGGVVVYYLVVAVAAQVAPQWPTHDAQQWLYANIIFGVAGLASIELGTDYTHPRT